MPLVRIDIIQARREVEMKETSEFIGRAGFLDPPGGPVYGTRR